MRAHSDASYLQLIVNEGGGAGASLEHTHAQLYALPFVPTAVARERERVGAYGERTGGGGLLSDVLVEEVRRQERLVAIDDEAALVCPWASRSPFELRVIPRREAARFEEDELGAAMIATAMRALAKLFDGPPELNLWIRTAPRGAEQFHWHVDIAPRLTIKAGFELGTGVDINVYPPERAAADLQRSASDEADPATDPALHRRHHPGGNPARALRRAPARGVREGGRGDRGPARRSRGPSRGRLVPRARLGRPGLGPLLCP